MNKRLICFFIILCVLLPSLVFASEYNRDKLDYANITQWHQLGYTGKGVTIIVNDKFGLGETHGALTVEVLKLIAPDAKLITTQRGYLPEAVRLGVQNKAQIITRSLYSEYWGDWDNRDSEIAYNNNIFLNGASGNLGKRGKSTIYLEHPHWFSTGAVHLVNGKPIRPPYSSWGDGLDVVGLSGWDTKYGGYSGTSASTPYISGLVALFQQRFKEQKGRFATISEVKDFIYSNCIDLEMKGYDKYTGHGLFILPKLNFIDEVIREKSNPFATKAYRKCGKETYIYIPFTEDMIKYDGYRLRR